METRRQHGLTAGSGADLGVHEPVVGAVAPNPVDRVGKRTSEDKVAAPAEKRPRVAAEAEPASSGGNRPQAGSLTSGCFTAGQPSCEKQVAAEGAEGAGNVSLGDLNERCKALGGLATFERK